MEERSVDTKKFHLIYKIVSILNQLKDMDARYDSSNVHDGIFTVTFEGTDYDVHITKHEDQKKSKHVKINVNENTNNINRNSISEHLNYTQIRKERILREFFNDLDNIIFDMFGDV